MNQSEQIDKLAPALVAAQSEFGMVAKSGENKYDKYDYAKLDDYVRVLRPVLAKHGLAVITSVDSKSEAVERKTKSGGVEYNAVVCLTVRLVHASGQWIETKAIGEGQDRGDKAVYKATTGGRKYALAAFFGLATSDDPEEDEVQPAKPSVPLKEVKQDAVSLLQDWQLVPQVEHECNRIGSTVEQCVTWIKSRFPYAGYGNPVLEDIEPEHLRALLAKMHDKPSKVK